MKAFFKVLSLCSFTLVLSATASAGNYYESSFEDMLEDYVALLAQTPNDDLATHAPEKVDQCQKRYAGILNDGMIDIRIALGYFDAFGDKAIDPGARDALIEVLTDRCRGTAQFCGFQKHDGFVFTKKVKIRGSVYTARIEMRHSAVSDSANRNVGKYHAQQVANTRALEAFYTNALRKADAAFYFGHSRNGGGPDFAPPILVHGKPDYSGYYLPQRPGFKLMARALEGQTQAPVIGLMSCDSRDHFLKKIRPLAPKSGVITTLAVMPLTQPYTAMVGAIDSLLRGQCNSFYKSLRLTPGNQEYITMDGMFERL